MLKLVSSSGHSLVIESNTFTVEPDIDIADIVHQNKHDKTQLLAALSMVDGDIAWAVEYDSELQARPPTFEYCLSVVSIIPDAHKGALNQIAELYGCGPNNLSVKLQDSNGAIYWGCHTRNRMFELVPPPDIPNSGEALAALYERVVLDGVPMDNWQAALAELGLSVVEEPQI